VILILKLLTKKTLKMDDFTMSARYTWPSQRDVIVGGCDAVPDISHFISEEIITTEIVPSRSCMTFLKLFLVCMIIIQFFYLN